MRNAKLLVLAAAASTVALAQSASAGILGERSLAASVDGVFFNEFGIQDGFGATIAYKQPVMTGVDVDFAYSYLDSGVYGGGIDINAHEASIGGTFFVTNQASKPYLSVGLVWFDAKAGGFSDDDFGYFAEAGIELSAGAKLVVAPYVQWVDGFDDDVVEGTFSGGVLADYAFSAKVSGLVRAEVTEDGDIGASLGARWRF